MADSHPFLRDRTRAVRQDFTLQNERGISAVECHERIARYHILCLHVLREWKDFSESQELEQLRKGEAQRPAPTQKPAGADGEYDTFLPRSPSVSERILR